MKKRVLIIEDNEQDRVYYKRLLSRIDGDFKIFEAYEVYESASETDALALYAQIQPDCVILDYHLPNINGLQLLEKLKIEANTDQICVVMITGQGSEAVAVKALKSGVTDYMVKDEISKEQFQKTIANAIERTQMRRQIDQQNRELEQTNLKLTHALDDVHQREDDLKEQAKTLKRINEDLDTFVYMASHDLKSPVNALSSLLQLFESRMSDELSAENAKILAMMKKSVHKLGRIINDLTQVALIQEDSVAEKESTNIKEVLSEVQEDLSELISSQNVEFDLTLDAEEILLARKNIRSILYNLISNAIKYKHPDRNPVVRLSTRQHNHYTVIEIADNGLGLTENQLAKLFTVFKRFHNHVDGSGVGLYMIKRLVENNDGQIEVKSQLHVGTTFTIYFPLP